MTETGPATERLAVPSVDAARERTGLEFLTSILAGELPEPPFSSLLGLTLVEAEPGRTVFEVTPNERHYNPIGGVHGGGLRRNIGFGGRQRSAISTPRRNRLRQCGSHH